MIEYENLRHKHLIPAIKLTEPSTYRPWEHVLTPYVVVRLSEFLRGDGSNFNSRFEEVRTAGGLHTFLGYSGKILLSSIMPDKMIFGFTPQMYVECIKALHPDFYMTPDGETYEDEVELSKKEIKRICEDTLHIVKECPESIPFGLVKGSTLSQIEIHTKFMRSFGIKFFVFHTGDFLRFGKLHLLTRSMEYAKRIRKLAPYLAIYGIGSKENMRKFFFANGFITQSHYTKAFYGKIMKYGKWTSYKGQITRDTIMNNLRELNLSLESLKKEYGGLIKWVVEGEALVYPMQHHALITKVGLSVNQ
jgi:hypothetical protein